MLSTDKLANYNNILASVKRLIDEKTKVTTIKALNELSDEQLQTADNRSDVLDKILRSIEYFNERNTKYIYGKDSILTIINLFSEGRYDRLININPNLLELLISCQDNSIFYTFDFNNYGGNQNNFSHLNDNKFCCLVKNEDFCKFLLKTDYMDSFLRISHRDDLMSNEDFKRCINNQDLILVYYFSNKDNTVYPLKHLMLSPNRNSMIDKLYSLEQEGKLYCNKETLDLILLNLPIIKQLVYNDVDNDIIETLESGDYKGIELLLEQVQGDIRQETGMRLFFIKYPNSKKPEEKYYPSMVDLDALKISCITTLIKNKHELSIEAQEKGRLSNPQVTPSMQSLFLT